MPGEIKFDAEGASEEETSNEAMKASDAARAREKKKDDDDSDNVLGRRHTALVSGMLLRLAKNRRESD